VEIEKKVTISHLLGASQSDFEYHPLNNNTINKMLHYPYLYCSRMTRSNTSVPKEIMSRMEWEELVC